MSWTTVRLADLAKISSGGGAPQDAGAFSAEGAPFVRAGSLIKLLEGHSEESLELLQPDVASGYNLKLFPAGTVLFAKSGMSATKGHIYQLKKPAYVVNHLAALIPHSEIEGNYLRHVLRFKSPTCLIKDEAYPSIRLGDVEGMEIPAPKAESERERIAAILDQADALRRLRQRSLDRLNTLSQAIFYEMFGDPVVNPKGLKSLPLAEVSSFTSGATPSKAVSGYWNGNIPWVSPKDMKSIIIDDSIDHVSERAISETNIKLIPKETPLIVVRGMILAHTVPLAITCKKVTINQDIKAIRFAKSVLPLFGLWCLKAQHNNILSIVGTAAHGTKRLDIEVLGQVPVIIPDLDQQVKFTDRIFECSNLIAKEEAMLTQLNNLFASLQHRAFRGEL